MKIKISKSKWNEIGIKAGWDTPKMMTGKDANSENETGVLSNNDNLVNTAEEESEFLLKLWERLWPKSSFKSDDEWLGYCRKWWPQIPEMLEISKKHSSSDHGGKKIKLSKNQWTSIGKQAGWMKTAQANQPIPTQPKQPKQNKITIDGEILKIMTELNKLNSPDGRFAISWGNDAAKFVSESELQSQLKQFFADYTHDFLGSPNIEEIKIFKAKINKAANETANVMVVKFNVFPFFVELPPNKLTVASESSVKKSHQIE